jgi:small subunit ribosomal protein S4
MARNRTPKGKICRRFGENIIGSEKYAKILARKNYRPGMHGKNPLRSKSEFGKQLEMKQKVRFIYGVMERQFRRYFEEVKNKPGVTGDQLMQKLENRLDNVVYRLGFATTRPQARQLVTHGLFTVNGRKVDIPSYSVKVGDVIAVKPGKEKSKYFSALSPFLQNKKDVPSWLSLDAKKYSGSVVSEPTIESTEQSIDPQLVVEFYSK